MYEKKFTLRHVIKNFSELNFEKSPVEEHFGVPWFLRLQHKNDFFSVYLQCGGAKDNLNPWPIETVYKMQLVPVTGETLVRQANYTFDTAGAYGWMDFNRWGDTLKEFMKDDTVTIECEVTIKKMTGIAVKRKMMFDEPEEHLTDVVLEVGEQKFHVSKVILATHSSYFKTLFFGGFSESKMANVELKDVDPESFQLLLEGIYGELNITGDTVSGLLKLADQFNVKLVCKRCEEFLQSDDKMAKQEKMRLADTYNLENLKSDILDSIETSEDLRAYLPINLADLSHSTLVALFEKNLSQC